MNLMSEELFGPAVSIRRFSDLDRAIAEANETPYGLAAGIFTADVGIMLDAAELLRVGTVHINEASSNRVDLMPFGGVKASGEGKEGPAYAITEMTEERLITIGRHWEPEPVSGIPRDDRFRQSFMVLFSYPGLIAGLITRR
ncbi:aldehyde dehydrogenase family protein [Kribbella sp. VKM Ac-2527]|uniref:Aldehyde dehydrogenase family protein n=1 Tax=Kribbella caucasensis TaxID=2512215 RepID=A0A4R6KMR7_9ACTN|nr:aldehyde dehydrogenase family protein [Kribbella sp. VKM Ac-2527]TDO51705.1 aldehyde dehydrogenase family protein [Kribbella sp. VKM Ac-2527]